MTIRWQPSAEELEEMDSYDLCMHARKEAALLMEQKQTAVPRLLLELATRVYIP